jgi:hypothetical protein
MVGWLWATTWKGFECPILKYSSTISTHGIGCIINGFLYTAAQADDYDCVVAQLSNSLQGRHVDVAKDTNLRHVNLE